MGPLPRPGSPLQSSWIRPPELGEEKAKTSSAPVEKDEETIREERADRKRRLGEDSYWDDDETVVPAALKDQEEIDAQNPFADDEPEPSVPAAAAAAAGDESEDELDNFMAGIEVGSRGAAGRLSGA